MVFMTPLQAGFCLLLVMFFRTLPAVLFQTWLAAGMRALQLVGFRSLLPMVLKALLVLVFSTRLGTGFGMVVSAAG